MSSFQNSSENNSDNAKQSWMRNGLLGLLLMGVLYLFYTQFGQNKKTDLTVSQIQMNAEEIKTINTDLQRLRDDIKDNRTNIQEKQKKIDALQAKLEKVYTQQNTRDDSDRETMMTLLKKQIAQLSVDKTRLQAQMTKTIGEYEVRIADFQKILQEKDSIITYQKNAIQDLESNVAIKKAEVNELQGELKETDDILNILDNKIHVTVTNVGFYSNGFDDADNELSDSKNKKDISEMGIFYSLSRKLQNNEKLIAELTLPNSAIVGKKEFTKQDIENIEKQSEKSGVDRPMSIRIQKGSFDTPLKVNFYIKAGAGEKHTFLIDSKLITDLKAKQVY
jgi:DNA repair exonuclease SbcCD ATPase subunit